MSSDAPFIAAAEPAGDATLRAALELSGIGTWEADLAADAWSCSRHTLALLGVAPGRDRACRSALVAAVHPADLGAVLAELRCSAADREPRDHAVQLRLTGLEDRVERWLVARWRTVLDQGGQVRRLVGTLADTTDCQATVRALRAADARKDEFLAMLGHELRNPLAPILTTLGILRIRGSAPRETEVIERQVRHLVRIVDDLLDLSRISRGLVELRRVPTELSHVVSRGVELATHLFEGRGHELVANVQGEGLVVDADPVRLAQVVGNVLTNAAKYTDMGGRIEVTAEREGDFALLVVADNGIGIEPALLARLFEPFVQGDRSPARSYGGLGIGLAVARRLVELHGGSLVARSEGAGRGSRFEVRVPLHGTAARRSDSVRLNFASGARNRLARVLVVDDNPDAAVMLADALGELGFETRVARDGAEALALAETVVPDCVLLDIGLPGVDGYEIARRLRAAQGPRRLRLVAVTGYGQDRDRERAREAGFDEHLVKPVDLSRLLAVLDRA